MTVTLDRNALRTLKENDALKSKDNEVIKILTVQLESALILNGILQGIALENKENSALLSSVMQSHVESTKSLLEAINLNNKSLEVIAAPKKSKVKISRNGKGLIEEMIIIPLSEEVEASEASILFGRKQ